MGNQWPKQWEIRYNDNYTEIMGAEEYAWTADRLLAEKNQLHPFIGDSKDYFLLYEAAINTKEVPGLVCEIGLRRGGGTKALMDGILSTGIERTVIAIDPYGNIPYAGMENELKKTTEYSNAMQKDILEMMYRFVQYYPNINFLFFPLEDTEFFKRYDDGVPVYVNSEKKLVNQYAVVHFDGPHNLAAVMEETKFFLKKTKRGSMFVYDDVAHFYNHSVVDALLKDNGWEPVTETKVKSSYKRIK
jgi:hypothetical protein